MKAAIINEYGSSDVIKVVDNANIPTAHGSKVVIKVNSASVNPIDYKIISGKMNEMVKLQFPKLIGFDLAGVVTELGDDVTDLVVGDEVYGQADFFDGGGSVAEFTTAKDSSVSPKPKNLDFSEASSLPLTAVSAYQALVDNMNLKADQKLLIHGGAGGIGSVAIQIGKYLGAYVAVTVAPKDKKFVEGLGADKVIDYKSEDFTLELSGYDAVLDIIGGDVYTNSFKVLKPQGIIVSLSSEPDSELSEKYDVKARYQGTKVNRAALLKISELIEAGAIKPIIQKKYKLDQAKDAFSHAENDHPQGKVVIDIN